MGVSSPPEAVTVREPVGAGSDDDGRAVTRPSASRVPLHRRMSREWRMYVLIVPGFLFFVVFRYVPMLGNVVAFQDYSPFLGFIDSPWVGWDNFIGLLDSPQVAVAMRNTVILSFLQIVFAFPAPIALALLLNSILSGRVRRFVQSVVYLPHFISWVIVISLWQSILGGDGLVSLAFQSLGLERINLMTNPDTFPWLVTAQVIWKGVGWGTIIFLAAITMIDKELYESAAVDGAGSARRMWHVTLPGLRSVIVLLLILQLGNVLEVGFEQLILQRAAVGANAAEVLDTYVYFYGVVGGDWGFGAAAGLAKGVIGTILVVGANRLAKRFGSEGAY